MAQSKTNDRSVDFSAALQGYPRDPKYLLPVLYKLQENYGFLSTEMLQEAARHLGVPVGKVYSLATFGEEFRLEPLGRCVIEVCSGACCRIKGSGVSSRCSKPSWVSKLGKLRKTARSRSLRLAVSMPAHLLLPCESTGISTGTCRAEMS